MSKKPNKKIAAFQQRVQWIATNLDPNPTYCKFTSDYNDIFTALEEAVRLGTFHRGETRSVPQRRQWQNALKDDNPSSVFLDWLYTLYPDLTPSHFEAGSFDEFLLLGRPIQESRERWLPAIRYFAKERTALARVAINYYRNHDDSHILDIDDLSFPLLTKPGWIRSKPILLQETTERQHLRYPDAGRSFSPQRLTGLRGDYVAYKGGIAYATRKSIKPEPQHNGEIFCAKHVLKDEHGFIGFEYFLSRYFSYINTCEVLGAELADWIIANKEEMLPPELMLRGAPENAYNLEARASYPGVNCLTVFLNFKPTKLHDYGNYFLIHKRDETQLQAQNTVHVVPAGGHQGFARGAQPEDTAIWRTMLREFAEELFNKEQISRQHETWADFLKYKDVKKIKDVFFGSATSAARAYLHGFGLDPITLKPEILITIIIDWRIAEKQWRGVQLKFNWELQTQHKNKTREQWERLSRQNLLRQARGGVQTIDGNDDTFLGTLPAGAACMIQTARHYDHLQLPA
ncbi:MAG TPA: hypothetical protein VH858_03805 [Hyphomicrobiales bacterium]